MYERRGTQTKKLLDVHIAAENLNHIRDKRAEFVSNLKKRKDWMSSGSASMTYPITLKRTVNLQGEWKRSEVIGWSHSSLPGAMKLANHQ